MYVGTKCPDQRGLADVNVVRDILSRRELNFHVILSLILQHGH
jgi:hypothetical protein